MQLTKIMFSMALMVGLVATSVAQDTDQKNDKRLQRVVKGTSKQLMSYYGAAKLTDEQKEKAVAVIKAHAKKLKDLRTAQEKLLTAEHKKARKAAIESGKAKGLKGPQLQKAAFKAMNLSAEEMKQLTEARKKVAEMMDKIKSEINKSLSDDQLASLKKKKGKGKGKKKSQDGSATQAISLNLPGMT